MIPTHHRHTKMTVPVLVAIAEIDEEEEPASVPTILVGLDRDRPTALPAPPPMPLLSTLEARLSASAIPDPRLLHGSTPSTVFGRPMRRMASVTQLRRTQGTHPSSPPSLPPPVSMRKAA